MFSWGSPIGRNFAAPIAKAHPTRHIRRSPLISQLRLGRQRFHLVIPLLASEANIFFLVASARVRWSAALTIGLAANCCGPERFLRKRSKLLIASAILPRLLPQPMSNGSSFISVPLDCSVFHMMDLRYGRRSCHHLPRGAIMEAPLHPFLSMICLCKPSIPTKVVLAYLLSDARRAIWFGKHCAHSFRRVGRRRPFGRRATGQKSSFLGPKNWWPTTVPMAKNFGPFRAFLWKPLRALRSIVTCCLPARQESVVGLVQLSMVSAGQT